VHQAQHMFHILGSSVLEDMPWQLLCSRSNVGSVAMRLHFWCFLECLKTYNIDMI
jgi:hypothetical protein